MFLNAPRFWFRQKLPFYGVPLLAMSWLWSRITRFKQCIKKSYNTPLPVLCCGGLTVGGSGKTMMCRDIVTFLQKHHYQPHIIMRGFGGKINNNRYVDPQKDTAQTVGDEALFLSQFCPVCVGGNRARSAYLAQRKGADCLIMDDGLQNFSLKKDYTLLIVDGVTGLGNQHVLPAGPLRELPKDAYRRVDAIVIIDHPSQASHYVPPAFKAVFHLTLQQELAEGLKTGDRVIAFAGIGHNDKFYAGLHQQGLTLQKTFSYPDHYPYRHKDIQKMLHSASDQQARLVTTYKDFMRIPPIFRRSITPIDVHLRWDNPGEQKRLLAPFLRAVEHA